MNHLRGTWICRPKRGQHLVKEACREGKYIHQGILALIRFGLEVENRDRTSLNSRSSIGQRSNPTLKSVAWTIRFKASLNFLTLVKPPVADQSQKGSSRANWVCILRLSRRRRTWIAKAMAVSVTACSMWLCISAPLASGNGALPNAHSFAAAASACRRANSLISTVGTATPLGYFTHDNAGWRGQIASKKSSSIFLM